LKKDQIPTGHREEESTVKLASLLLLAVFLHCTAGVAAADEVIVDLDGFLSPITKIQDGLDAVSDGGTVYVWGGRSGRGVYRGPRNRNLDFGDKNINVESLAGGEVVIDCEGLDRAFNLSTSVDSTSRIVGFTIVNGATDGDGGAICAAGGLPVVTHCDFRDNSASSGGAIWAAGGPVRVRACDFYSNAADEEGGAISVVSSDTAIRNCVFHGNTAAGFGSVAVTGNDPVITGCSFARNRGAAAACVGIDGTGGVIERCILAFSSLGVSVSATSPEIFYCCVYDNQGGNGLPGDAHDNMVDVPDPLFCDMAGRNLDLCSNSDCLPSENPWEVQIGARAQGCGECTSPVHDASWGAVKSLFR
jgi:hypothetical protein